MTRPIIAVDDSDIARELITLTLSEFGYDDVRSFGDPHDALAAMTEQSVPADLILLDVMMPGIDGPTTLGKLREQAETREIPVIFMTAKVQPSELDHYRAIGALDVVIKPFDPMTLAAQLREIWERSDAG